MEKKSSTTSLLYTSSDVSINDAERNTNNASTRSTCSRSAGHLLMILLGMFMILMFIALSVMVVHLNYKINNIEELSMLEHELARLGNSQVYVQQLGADVAAIPAQVQTIQSINDGNGLLSKGLHLTGVKSYLRIDDDSGNAKASISNWQDKSASGVPGKLRLVNSTAILVEEDGFYMIYAQITWRMKQGVAVFEISKSDSIATLQQASSLSLAKCINNFQEKYAVMKTCYTSTTANLKRGDTVTIMVLKDEFSIDFDNGRSFFGAVSLGLMDRSKFS